MTALNDEMERPTPPEATPACTAGFQKSGHVNALLSVEPRLAEHFSNATLQILTEEFAARLLAAGRLEAASKGM